MRGREKIFFAQILILKRLVFVIIWSIIMFLEFIVFILCSLNFYSNFDLFSSLLKFVICKGKQERGNNYEEG